MKYGLLLAPLAIAFYMGSQNQEDTAVECEASRSDRIRGNYENKIRFFAAPEKVFEIFASEEDEGDQSTQMSYSDFLHCLTPYNNGELISDEDIKEYLKNNTPRIFEVADPDKNGQISYTEFIFFLTLHQVGQGRLRR